MNNKAAQIEYAYIVAFNSLIIILSFTSIPVVFTTAMQWFASLGLPQFGILIGANVVAIAYYAGVEVLISILLPYAAGEITSSRMSGYEKKKRRYIRGVLAIGFALTCVSMSMSYFFSQDAAQKMSKKVDIKPFQSIQETQSRDYGTTVASLDTDLKEARRTEKSRVKAAIAAGPERWQELYNERNGWFLRQKGKIGRYLASIESEKAKASELEKEKRQFVLSGSTKKDEILASVAGVQLAQAEDAKNERSRNQMVLFIIACGAGVIAVFMAFMLGWHRASEGQQVEDAPMSPAMIISRLSGRVWRYISGNVSERYELSFQHATTGATQATKQQDQGRRGTEDSNPESLSDTGSRQNVRYIDLKSDIDRIRRALRYNWKRFNETGDGKYKGKINEILKDSSRGVAWLKGMDFECSFDFDSGKLSIEEPK